MGNRIAKCEQELGSIFENFVHISDFLPISTSHTVTAHCMVLRTQKLNEINCYAPYLTLDIVSDTLVFISFLEEIAITYFTIITKERLVAFLVCLLHLIVQFRKFNSDDLSSLPGRLVEVLGQIGVLEHGFVFRQLPHVHPKHRDWAALSHVTRLATQVQYRIFSNSISIIGLKFRYQQGLLTPEEIETATRRQFDGDNLLLSEVRKYRVTGTTIKVFVTFEKKNTSNLKY